jgi:hypothetical protein
MPTADRALFFLLRFNAILTLLAAPCALLPFAWMDTVHRDWLGLGPLPDALITRYMARSLSLAYALHGTIVLFLTLDWERYRPIAPVLGWLHISFGCAMLAVDLDTGLPWWWVVGEGPFLVADGVLILLLYRRASCDAPNVQRAGG